MHRIIDDPNERQWGMLVHIAALATFILPVAGNIIGPLIIYLTKKDEYEFVAEQGKEVLNFQITWSIIFFISIILIFVGIGILMLVGFGIAWLVLVIVASVSASNGTPYKYPFTIRFLQ
ncbi:hypothetical protein SAMN05444285_13563 [Draconibacterium orientale]|jgi:hypothetical protein|uniref:Orotate phosphoribosyltransferase n=1 Tax=Draconibacterium orientale TaxID=1168034 RepID=X5DZR9_9BACT|nr:DUF4870 domain-containing protein [Draconibacterium orientale]AHW60740.1 orotate phosphoribosyltransferase [Draconibacterium orientale]SEU02170.1 hypothetical protein SAMN05444285_13563 [Draconibacterium orientale]